MKFFVYFLEVCFSVCVSINYLVHVVPQFAYLLHLIRLIDLSNFWFIYLLFLIAWLSVV